MPRVRLCQDSAELVACCFDSVILCFLDWLIVDICCMWPSMKPQLITMRWRAAQDPSRIWRATRRQATRIRARKSFCPQDEASASWELGTKANLLNMKKLETSQSCLQYFTLYIYLHIYLLKFIVGVARRAMLQGARLWFVLFVLFVVFVVLLLLLLVVLVVL
jgi:hypothetical protein